MPYPSAIFIRDKALVVNVESMRLIICQDEVLVLSVPDAEHPSQPAFPTPDCPFVKDLVQRVSEQKLSFASDHNLHVDTSLPYELRALEAVLARGRPMSNLKQLVWYRGKFMTSCCIHSPHTHAACRGEAA